LGTILEKRKNALRQVSELDGSGAQLSVGSDVPAWLHGAPAPEPGGWLVTLKQWLGVIAGLALVFAVAMWIFDDRRGGSSRPTTPVAAPAPAPAAPVAAAGSTLPPLVLLKAASAPAQADAPVAAALAAPPAVAAPAPVAAQLPVQTSAAPTAAAVLAAPKEAPPVVKPKPRKKPAAAKPPADESQHTTTPFL
jgi:hypothetical protein